MKIELQAGDTIAIPNGCKAVIKDNVVIFEKQEFKDGDILVTITGKSRDNAFIYKSTDKDGFHSYYVGIDNSKQLFISTFTSNRWDNSNLDYATEDEKQLLFDKMKEQGLKWNAEEKRVEKIRWRAPEKSNYWCCSIDLSVMKTADYRYEADQKMYNCGNYFRTKEQAEAAAKRVKEVLYKYHEEIGE